MKRLLLLLSLTAAAAIAQVQTSPGHWRIIPTPASAGEIDFAAKNNLHHIGIASPDTLSGTVLFRLPPADGSPGQVLSTDGSGNLSFASAGLTPPVTISGSTAGDLVTITQSGAGNALNVGGHLTGTHLQDVGTGDQPSWYVPRVRKLTWQDYTSGSATVWGIDSTIDGTHSQMNFTDTTGSPVLVLDRFNQTATLNLQFLTSNAAATFNLVKVKNAVTNEIVSTSPAPVSGHLVGGGGISSALASGTEQPLEIRSTQLVVTTNGGADLALDDGTAKQGYIQAGSAAAIVLRDNALALRFFLGQASTAYAGRVGINTSTPAANLDVSGTANVSGALTVGSCSGCLSYSAGSGISISGSTISNSGILSLTAGTGISVSGSTITNEGVTNYGGSGIKVEVFSGTSGTLSTYGDGIFVYDKATGAYKGMIPLI